MKVAVFCHQPIQSGANQSLYDWVSSANKSILDIYIVLPFPNKALQTLFENAGCTVWIGFYSNPLRHLENRPFAKKVVDFLQFIYAFLFNDISYYVLMRRIIKNNIDIIQSNSFATLAGAIIAKRCHKPHVWHIRELMREDHKIEHFGTIDIESLCRYSDAIFISSFVKEKYSSYKFKSQTVINDQVVYDAHYANEKKFLDSGLCRMMIAGTIMKSKGQLEAIKATRIVHDLGYEIILDIYGKGDLEYIQYAYKDIPYIRYCGQKNNLDEIRTQYDIGLTCSSNEALGRVTIEAMYYGNLVIGADAGFTPYIIQNNAFGFLYKQGDESDLAKKIIYAITHRDESQKKICSAKEYAIDHYSHPIDNLFLAVYEDALNVKEK